jgi:carboxymethylenebutenolidase
MNKFIILILVIIGVVLVIQYAPEPNNDTSSEVQEESNVLGEPTMQVASAEMVPYFGEVEGYLAVPEGEGPFPALILIHEWWGLNDNIKNLAEDFAEQGYVALAVDLYSGESADTPEQARELAGAVRENVEPAFANLEAATEYLAGLEVVDGERLASVGWCFGGQWAYNMAVNNMNVDATVMYYGRFMPEDDLSMMRADILGHFGEEDASIPVDTVEEFEAKLSTLEGDHAIFIYPNAGHAFANEDNEDAYNEEAANLAWERTLEFLGREVE